MSTLEEIARELDKGSPCILYRQDLAEILRRLAAVSNEEERQRKDAERYRWLREHFRFANDSMRELWFDPVLEPNDSGVPDDLDQEIDRAMSGANA